jgi:tRNA pseudouridine32 synthase/23S rRNA pseudouridine746 synthase
MTQHIIKKTYRDSESVAVVDYLSRESGLSKQKIKTAMSAGAVWLRKPRSKQKRLRRAKTLLNAGDEIALFYDEAILERTPPEAKKLWTCNEYSLWYKPPGLMAQGNEFGDHASLLRQAERADPLRKPVYLIHRLDREAGGLMLLAHTQTAARRLSQLFQRQQVEKAYHVSVRGRMEQERGEIKQPLDGKPAHSTYRVLGFDKDNDCSELEVSITTGRTHQIRRHLNLVGHPVMGDPRYGKGNKNAEGLQLTATRLQFECPFSGETRGFDLAGFEV